MFELWDLVLHKYTKSIAEILFIGNQLARIGSLAKENGYDNRKYEKLNFLKFMLCDVDIFSIHVILENVAIMK